MDVYDDGPQDWDLAKVVQLPSHELPSGTIFCCVGVP